MATNDDIAAFDRKIKQTLNEWQSTKTLAPIAQEMANVIRLRTRDGYGVDKSGGSLKKLAKLKPSTIESRQRLQKQGKLSGDTEPKKSNLTATGQMLNSLKGRAINQLIEVAPTGDRNIKVAQYAADGSADRAPRKFLNFSADELKQLTGTLSDKLSEILERVFRI